VLEYDGLTVYIDPRSLEVMGTRSIPARLLGAGIQFKNPRVKKSCGCGESFTSSPYGTKESMSDTPTLEIRNLHIGSTVSPS